MMVKMRAGQHLPVAAALLAALTGLVAAGGRTSQPPSGTTGPALHLVIISFDGLMPSAYLESDRLGLKVPALRWMKETGVYARGVRGVLPTLTFPSHTTLVTGVNPSRHGIETNLLFDPYERNNGGLMWYAEDLRARTLWDVARAAGKTSSTLFWPVTVGATVDWNIPAFWRVGGGEDTRRLVRALSTPGLMDDIEKAVGPFRPEDMSDDQRARIGLHVMRKYRPTVLMLHLIDLDEAQHANGPGSAEAHARIESTTAAIDLFIDGLRSAGMLTSTAIAVASDHGFSLIAKAVRPAVVFRQQGWVTYQGTRVVDWKAAPVIGGGLCAVVLRDTSDAALLARIRATFTALAADPANGIGQIYEKREIAAMGGYRDAALLIEVREGFRMIPGSEGDLVVSSTQKGAHGYTPGFYGQRASFLAAGPGLPGGRDIGEIRMIDIAPTLAALVGLSLPDAEGRVLDFPTTR
jgi:predicted AlkP superfamily pyrophosphatase or phosphodiesterase